VLLANETSSTSQEVSLAHVTKVFVVNTSTLRVRLRCAGASVCKGTLKLTAQVAVGYLMSKERFSVAAGKSATLYLRLKSRGKTLLRKAGKRGIRVQMEGDIARRTVVLRGPH
jgi:hypothetical protein